MSFLDEKGQPGIVERAFVLPPHSRIGPITPPERQAIIQGSVIFGHYEKTVDRESAYEMLKARAEKAAAEAEAQTQAQAEAQARQPSPYEYPAPVGPGPGPVSPGAQAAGGPVQGHPDRGHGQERRPVGRQQPRPADPARRPRLDLRRQEVIPLLDIIGYSNNLSRGR